MGWVQWGLLALAGSSLIDLWLLLEFASGNGIAWVAVSQTLLCGYGFFRLRRLEVNTLFFVTAETQKGQVIVKELWEEVLLILGALFLLVPGFFNSFIGLVLLHRKSRLALAEIIDQSR